QTENPLRDACQFVRPEGSRPLTQWIANTVAWKAIYAQSGEGERAANRASALLRLETALGAILGDKVTFSLQPEPFAVLASIGERPAIPIAQLPDGVQSLLSWMADLLMRLDRIPWAEPGPVTDRRFTLLLDEVEVHLHPAWQRMVIPTVERLFPHAQIIA